MTASAAIMVDRGADIAAISAALRALQPRRQSATEMVFSKVYPDIVETLQRNVPKRALISALKDVGLKLSPAKFNALLAAEAARRGDDLTLTVVPRAKPSSLLPTVT